MKECLECKSTLIRYEKSTRTFVCGSCGFRISRMEYYKLLDQSYKSSKKNKEDKRKELYKWLISSKKQ